PDEAGAAFERALVVDKSSAAAYAGLGKMAAARGEPAAAVRHFKKALEIEPGASALRYPLAIAYRELGRIDDARRQLQLRGDVEVSFEDPLIANLAELAAGSGIHVMAGNRALRKGQVEVAIDRYRRALAANPRSFEAHQALAAVLVEQGAADAAVEHYSAALEAEPDNPRVLYNLGTLFAQKGDVERAVRHFQAALELAPEYVDARFNLAAALAGSGRHDEALAHYRKLLEIAPDDTEARIAAHRQLARSSAQNGRFGEAVEHFGAVIEDRPDDLDARFGQVMALLLSERYAEARARLEEGRAALPRSPELAHLMARFLATCPVDRLRDGERALEIAQALLRSSQRPDVAETVAMGLAEVGRFDEAVAMQKQLIREAERAGAAAVVDPLRDRLTLYEQGKPSRAPWILGVTG
ncbi:MAG: tetratricopeptide repeat protein, partial [Thermoanaerobaculia bacterium]